MGTAAQIASGNANTINIWYRKLNRLASLGVQIHEESGAVTAQAIKRMAYTKTPRRSGKAAGSWVVVKSKGRLDIVNTAPHWQFIRQGTGKYGPGGNLIVPKAAGKTVFYKKGRKVLAFVKEGETKFRAWSRGMRPRDPMGSVNITPPIEEGRRYVRDKLGRFMST